MQDIFLSDFSDERFQAAFRLYFAELGIAVHDWDGLWKEMNDDENAENHACVRMDDNGQMIGFIQFCEMTMQSWFFEEKVGFVREFWVRSEARGQGHGSTLLALAEEWFRQRGIRKCILTTDTAPEFYKKQGYQREEGICARNRDDVFVKKI